MPAPDNKLAAWWNSKGRLLDAISDFYSVKTWDELNPMMQNHIKELFESCQH